jgi:hypothetical protein
MSETRAEVYRAIDSERNYHDSVVKNKYGNDAEGHPVAAEILMIEEYAARARKEWTDQKGDEAALNMIRKVAGLCVRCMEHHGAPHRSFSVETKA